MASLRINHHFITLAVAATALLNSVTSGFRYIIGDSIWAVPPSSDFYSSWSSSHSFYAGDSIVFEFGIELFNVVQVMRNDYESCIADSPLKVYRSSPAIVELTYKGAFYYICNVSNYCDLGQKVSIVVLQRPPSSAPMPSPSSPLPSGSPPPPPSSSSSTSPLPSGSPSPPSSMLPPSVPIVPIPDPFPSPGVAAEPSQDGENSHSPPPGASDSSSSSSISNRASSKAVVYFLIGLVVAFFDSRMETWIVRGFYWLQMEKVLFMLSLLILLSLLCFNNPRPCHGIDRITANQSLTGDQTLVSPGEVFELGFFKPGKSEKYYIGIWYKQVSPRKVIWVANRFIHVSDRFSAELKISDDGDLVLFVGGSNSTAWSTYLRATHNSSSVKAVLLDQGNLVLLPTNGSSLSSPFTPDPLWQSFDYPGNTWVSGSKIGFNKVTQREVYLTSWKNREDPTPGPFSLRLGPNLSLEIEWNMDNNFFPSGVRRRRVMELNPMNNSVYVDNQNERYITYSQYDSTQLAKIAEEESDQEIQQQLNSMHKSKYGNDSLFSQYVMGEGGQVQLMVWLESTKQWISVWKHPGSLCEINGYCGAYGSCTEKSRPVCHCLMGFVPLDYNSDAFHGDCNRRSPLQCQKSDWFSPNYNVGLPRNPEVTSIGRHPNWKDIPNGKTIYIKLAASEFSTLDNNRMRIIIGSVVSSGVLLILVVFIILRWRKQKSNPGKLMEGLLVAFTHRDLRIATRNFSEKLGEGGFGSVYKGTLPDSSVVAVKKLESINFRQAENHKQFLAEVRTLGTIQHVNLVGLRGFSSDNNTMMLVYDYMPNGSIASHLFKGKDDSNTLDWKTRYSIALGTARGLAYIHEKCRECIVHCDIKPDNVLLDSEFRPKVADFGMAKLFGRDFSKVLTTLRGTIGYMAPEWISGEAITAKADVYSYGMVLLELVSGMRNSQRHACIGHYFPVWVANVINEGGNVAELLDPRLQGNADIEELKRVCTVGVWCIQDDESHRPTMSQVVYILEQVSEVNIPPVPRILQRFVDPDSGYY
ncbi:G-type lectin S-receptor-like serine/threonine-protein kinase At2g19130 [Linum perenne]